MNKKIGVAVMWLTYAVLTTLCWVLVLEQF